MTRTTIRANMYNVGHFLTMLVLVLLPYHAFFSVWIGSNLNAYRIVQVWKEATIVVVLVGLLFVIPCRNLVQYILRYKYLFGALSLYILLTLVSGVLSYTHSLVDAEVWAFASIINLRFLIFFIMTYLLFSAAPRKFYWLKVLLIPVIPILVFGLLQKYFLPPRFLELFGYSKWTILPFQYVNDQANLLRVQSFLRGANPLGAYLALVIPAAIYKFFVSPNGWKKFSWAIVCGLSTLVLFYTYSRSAWLGVFVGLAIMCALYVSRESSTSRTQLLYAASALMLLVFIATVNLPGKQAVRNVIFHSNTASVSASTSNGFRLIAIHESIVRIQSHPLGYGLGTAGPASVRNTKVPAFIPEDYFLQLAIEVGLEGLILFLLINSIVAYHLWLRRTNGLAIILLASLSGVTVINVLSHAWTDDTLSLLWWGLAGIVLAAPAKDNELTELNSRSN